VVREKTCAETKGVGVVRDKELKLEDDEASHTQGGAMPFLKRYNHISAVLVRKGYDGGAAPALGCRT
jgi:hypothetical protein